MQYIEKAIEAAMEMAKERIRKREKFRSQIEYDPKLKTYLIGYGRDLTRRPLDGVEVDELL